MGQTGLNAWLCLSALALLGACGSHRHCRCLSMPALPEATTHRLYHAGGLQFDMSNTETWRIGSPTPAWSNLIAVTPSQSDLTPASILFEWRTPPTALRLILYALDGLGSWNKALARIGFPLLSSATLMATASALWRTSLPTMSSILAWFDLTEL